MADQIQPDPVDVAMLVPLRGVESHGRKVRCSTHREEILILINNATGPLRRDHELLPFHRPVID